MGCAAQSENPTYGNDGVTARRDEQFRAYVLASRGGLVRTATFLASGDRFQAEDLVQTALMRLYVAWPRVRAETMQRRGELFDHGECGAAAHMTAQEKVLELLLFDLTSCVGSPTH